MAKQVQKNRSKLAEEGVIPGCLWGFFHSFDVHQRLRLRRILGERRGAHGRHATGIKVPKTKMDVTLAGDEHDLAEADANISSQVEGRIDSVDKASGKTQMRALIAQEMSKQKNMPKQKGQKRKVTPFATRLLRTISIHHMECNDYVRPDEMPDGGQVQEEQLLPHNSNSSPRNGHMLPSPNATDEFNKVKQCEVCGTLSGPASYVGHKKLDVLGYQLLEKQALLREKLREAKKSLLEQQKGDKELQGDAALQHSQDLLEALELFNAEEELFLKILPEPGTTMANYFQGQEDSRSGIVLTKSSSFPGARFSPRSCSLLKPRDETVPIKMMEGKSENEDLQSLANVDFTKSDGTQVAVNSLTSVPCIHGIYETASISEFPSSSVHVEESQRDNGTTAYGFKVIKQRIKDIIKENRKESHRISMDRFLHKIPYGCRASHDIKDEKSCHWEGPDSDRCDGDSSRNSFGSDGAGSTYRNSIRQMRRSQSLTDSLEKYASLLESSFSREPRRQMSERLKLVREETSFQATKPLRTFGRLFSLPEFESDSLGKDDQSEVTCDLHSRSTSLDLSQGHNSVGINGSNEQKLSDILDYGHPDRGVLDYEIFAVSDVLTAESTASTSLNDRVIVTYMEGSNTPAKPSSISVFDSEEDPLSTPELSVIRAETELKANQIHFEEEDHSDNPPQQSDVNDTTKETDVSDINEVQIPAMQLDLDALHFQVDKKHEVEFHYVRDMLKTYLFNGHELSERWRSPDKQLNPLVPGEVECSTEELESNNRYSEINLDHALLHDLTNEVLLDIFESSYGHYPWLPQFGSHVRPIPVGYHILEEVWTNVSWHLKSQPHANPTLEYVVDRDFKKNDGWMNISYDMEDVGLDLEALLLHDLLDEAILEFLDSDSHQCPTS
uniref:Vitellogenin-A2 n=1 Tax=Anthurium amnicola TaxID=1678845 RepID=A0A1D1ZM77_9ARAE